MEKFLESLVPNPVCFYNKILNKNYEDIDQITKEEFITIIEYFKSLDVFFPKKINIKNYKYETIEKKEGYSICNQFNLVKNSCMKIICYDYLLTLDFDNISYEEMKQNLEKTEETFYIYKTFKGYHVYCLSKEYSPRNYKTLNMMYSLGCDPVYISFCKQYGFCVRLSKKKERNEKYVEEFISILGKKKIKKNLYDLLLVKDNFLKKKY